MRTFDEVFPRRVMDSSADQRTVDHYRKLQREGWDMAFKEFDSFIDKIVNEYTELNKNRGEEMKVWIVCDNTNEENPIIPFESKKKAENYVDKRDVRFPDDCWIYDDEGTVVQ